MWDSHCHLDYLGKNLAREGVQEGHRLEISLRLDGQELGNKFGGVVANFCNPQVGWWGGSGGGIKGGLSKLDVSPLPGWAYHWVHRTNTWHLINKVVVIYQAKKIYI